jgi:hypothetical protein
MSHYPELSNTGTFYRLLLWNAIILALFPFVSHGQSVTCKDFRTGVYYNYPKNSDERDVIERDEKFQRETNLTNNDSITWEISWKDDCTYSLKYVSGGKKLSKEILDVIQKHNLVSVIETITPDYYTYSVYFDKKSNLPIGKDTMWLHEKAVVTNNELFKPYKTRTIPAKDHFRDTSKYAIVYIYRPGKLTNSLGNYIVYLDENVLWVAKNNSGYLFKVLKEGRHTFKSRLMKDQSSIDVDIQFGKIYYVKSTMKWGIYKHGNFKLGMETVKPDIGQTEFDEVEFR